MGLESLGMIFIRCTKKVDDTSVALNTIKTVKRYSCCQPVLCYRVFNKRNCQCYCLIVTDFFFDSILSGKTQLPHMCLCLFRKYIAVYIRPSHYGEQARHRNMNTHSLWIIDCLTLKDAVLQYRRLYLPRGTCMIDWQNVEGMQNIQLIKKWKC